MPKGTAKIWRHVICAMCSVELHTLLPGIRFCSERCKKDKWNIYRLEYRKNEHVQRREKNAELLSKYELSIEEYERLFSKQDYKCAICETTNLTKRQKYFHVDHIHGTPIVRGLLCKDCNTGLGSFKDVPELLKKAALYVLAGEEMINV